MPPSKMISSLLPAVLVALSVPIHAQNASSTAASTPAPAYEQNPKFKSAMADANTNSKNHELGFAVDALKKANKIAGGQCTPCLESAYKLQTQYGDFKGAAETASMLVSAATTPKAKSIAETQRGIALFRQGGEKPKPAQLEAARTSLAAALTDYPKNNAALYEQGCVLARLGQNGEASKQFAACADVSEPGDALGIRARRFSNDPALSMQKRAPAFTVTALDGKQFNLDDMGGRVVLIDFWATWCGPCNQELPHLKKIAQEFAGQPLVIISISWDKDEQKWRDFIAKHEMTWVQYRDADHRLSSQFGVESIPHYFTIDADGVLTAEMLGQGSDVEGKLKKLLKRARENPSDVATAQPPLVASTPQSDTAF